PLPYTTLFRSGAAPTGPVTTGGCSRALPGAGRPAARHRARCGSALVAARVLGGEVRGEVGGGGLVGDGHARHRTLSTLSALGGVLGGLVGGLREVLVLDLHGHGLACPLALAAVLGLEDHELVVGLDDQAVEAGVGAHLIADAELAHEGHLLLLRLLLAVGDEQQREHHHGEDEQEREDFHRVPFGVRHPASRRRRAGGGRRGRLTAPLYPSLLSGPWGRDASVRTARAWAPDRCRPRAG